MERADAELIEASRRGDRAAFGELVERYQHVVGAVAYSGTRDRTLGEDIAQDTFVAAWRRLDTLRDPQRLPAWLCGIARNLTRVARRRRGRETSLDDRDPAGDGTPFDAISERETEAVVAAALERVPDKYREPLVLFYREQRSIKDVARALGISEQAAHQRMTRGRQYLADDVAGLVEHALEKRPRRDLAASVLAAIAVAVGSSHVDASPITTGGSSMWKIGIIAAVIAVVVSTGYIVQRSSADPARPKPHSAEAARTTDAPGAASAHRALPTPALPASPAGAASSAGAATGAAGATGAVVVDCHAAARRLGELAPETQPDMPRMPAEKRDKLSRMVAEHYELKCTRAHWSPAYMKCVIAANDMFSATIGCGPVSDEIGAAPADIAGLGVPDSATPIPPASLDDLGCRAAAVHVAALARPGAAALDKVAPSERDHMRAGIERTLQTLPDIVEGACEQGAWSEATRRCVVLSTLTTELEACMAARR